MRKITQTAIASAALIVLGGVSAHSQSTEIVTLTPGGGWSVFDFAGVGSNFQDLNGDPLIYQFTVSSPDGATLEVTDGYNAGDRFSLSMYSSSGAFCCLLSSPTKYNSSVYNPSYYIGPNWDKAFEAPYSSAFSHATLYFAPGTYDVTGTEYAAGVGEENYGGFGAGAINLIPEPASWTLMLIGVAGAGFALRRARRLQTKRAIA